MLFLQAVISSILSTPLIPFLGSAVFLTSYTRYKNRPFPYLLAFVLPLKLRNRKGENKRQQQIHYSHFGENKLVII